MLSLSRTYEYDDAVEVLITGKDSFAGDRIYATFYIEKEEWPAFKAAVDAWFSSEEKE
jgi:hypothetical protein